MSIEQARDAVKKQDIANAEQIYLGLLSNTSQATPSDKLIQVQESAITELGELYRDTNQVDRLVELVPKVQAIVGTAFAKSKTSKIIRSLIDLFRTLPGDNALDLAIGATKDTIEWAKKEKRSFLRQSLQFRLATLYFEKQHYNDALPLINALIREYKKLDDKSSLVDVQLLESKVYFALRNYSKSRAALTSARTSANSIYCPTSVQAELDLLSGVLNAEDKDFKTAFSYFYESFESFNLTSSNEEKTIKVLKYMLLSKIMLSLIDDVNNILNNKSVAKYSDNREIEAMKLVSKLYANRSLKEFEDCLTAYNNELTKDIIIRSHLTELYDSLLEQNLLKLIEPYSVIEISFISNKIGLSSSTVESKLSQMILDKVFYGVLDQGNGWLIIYDEPQVDENYGLALDLIKRMSTSVDLLYEKAAALN